MSMEERKANALMSRALFVSKLITRIAYSKARNEGRLNQYVQEYNDIKVKLILLGEWDKFCTTHRLPQNHDGWDCAA